MKNFVYKVEFYSGFYETYFYKQVDAIDEKDAIIQAVSFFKDLPEEETNNFLSKNLGNRWNANTFWAESDTRFQNSDGSVGYDLIWLKEINFDLDSI